MKIVVGGGMFKMGKDKYKKLYNKLDKESYEIKQLVKLTSKRLEENMEDKLESAGFLSFQPEKKRERVKLWIKKQLKDPRIILILIVMLIQLWKLGAIDYKTYEMLLEAFALG